MPFLCLEQDTGVLEGNAYFAGVNSALFGSRVATPALKGGYMFVESAADIANDGPRIDDLREAIQANRVSFPVPVPIFPAQFRPDIQWRLVQLYFVRGWSSKRLAERYGVTARRIQQSLQHWVNSAMSRGYLQAIPAETIIAIPARPWTAVPAPAMQHVPMYSPIPANAAPDFAAHHTA